MKEPANKECDFTVPMPRKLTLAFKKMVIRQGFTAKIAIKALMAAVVDGQLSFTKNRHYEEPNKKKK